jgi:3'5'-cyclic nucleotide phosphodiesterase
MSAAPATEEGTDPAQSKPPYAALALSLTVQDWSQLGVDESTSPTPNMDVMVSRVTSLLLVRLVAVATNPKDCSTAGICRSALLQGWQEWPSPVTGAVISQVQQYARTVLGMYHPENPYHNAQHATHVVMSTAHLIDQLLHSKGANSAAAATNSRKKKGSASSLFGLRHDPICLLALVFAALIHDAHHPGVPNRQLSAEDDDLAVLYNDQSVAEQHSLRLGFTELLRPEYADLQRLLGMNRQPGGPAAPSDAAATYRRFRKHVINLVLNTDIASPERTQLFKSKFREAFPPPPPSAVSSTPAGTILASDYNIRLDDDDDDDDPVDKNGGEEEGSMLQHFLRREGAISFGDDQGGGVKPRSASLPTPSTMSLASPGGGGARRFRQRLGIRRSMDLSGEAIEAFSTHSRGGAGDDPSGGGSSNNDDDDGFHIGGDDDDDDTDELKASVVLECIMTACDVAHNLQGFAQMCTWSKRLYLELLRAHEQNRGPDPATKWFENQIGFLESYLIPLAARLDETGVFDLKFAAIVRNSLDQWLVEGLEFTEAMIQNGSATP